jgi:hypothetical protein
MGSIGGAQLRKKCVATVGMSGARLDHKLFMRRYRLPSFKVGTDILDSDEMIDVILW